MGHPGWQFFPFLCVGNQILGGVSWVGHPGSLASFWWKFSDRWNYLARNCWRLSSSPRLTWKGPSGHRDVSKQLLERPKMWSAVRWHRGYMYQRINDCYVFFIAIYNNHKWALVVRYWWYKISWWKLMWNPMCNSMWREFTLSRVTSGYSNSLANCGNEVVGKLRWKTMEKHWWKTMETPCQRHGKKTVEHHATLFWAETHGHTLVENFWWKTTEKYWWTTKENRCWKTADKMMENLENHWQHLVESHGETISTDFWLGACRYPCTMRQVTSGYWHSSIGSLPTAVSSAGACLCFEHATPIACHFLPRFSQPVQTFGSAMLRGVGAWQPQKSIGSTVYKSNHDYL